MFQSQDANGASTWKPTPPKESTRGTYRNASNKPVSTGGYDYVGMIAELYAQQMAAQRAARKAAYDATVTQQNNTYNSSVGKVNGTADKSLQEAYVNRMLSEKNINQQLAAQGLNGGATESTLAGIQNNYGNSRNNIEQGRGENLAGLSNTLQNNLAQAYSAFQGGAAGDYSNYASNLASLVASNMPTSVNRMQGGNISFAPLPYQQLLRGYATSDDAKAVSMGGADSALLNNYLKRVNTY